MDIKEKIAQMFIYGVEGDTRNNIIEKAIKSNIGGIILFATNIKSYSQASNFVQSMQNIAKIPLFISIDQEGGLVERTINIENRINYLTPMALAATENINHIKNHSQIELFPTHHSTLVAGKILSFDWVRSEKISFLTDFAQITDPVRAAFRVN